MLDPIDRASISWPDVWEQNHSSRRSWSKAKSKRPHLFSARFLEGAGADNSKPGEANRGVAAPKDPYVYRKTQKVFRKIPQKTLKGACGVTIFTCFRRGLAWSGASGSGLVVARLLDGSWLLPIEILISTVA